MLAAWLLAGPAEPGEFEDLRAQAHFDRGAKLWKAGDYEGADAEMAAAAAIETRPVLRYAQGQIARELGDCERALEYYQEFLETTEPNTRAREEVLMNMARCQATMPVAPEPTAPTPKPITEPPPDQPPPDQRSPRVDRAAVGLLAAGSVVTAAGIGLGIAAGLDFRSADEAALLDDFDRHRRQSRIELGMGIAAGSVGVALLVAGIVRWVRHPPGRPLDARARPLGPLRF
ncbi:MAG: hypothetical protein AAGF11_42920 [Myxococcota bacterium]